MSLAGCASLVTGLLIQTSSQPHAAKLRSPSQSARNPTTEFQLGVIRDATIRARLRPGSFYWGCLSASIEPGKISRLTRDPASDGGYVGETNRPAAEALLDDGGQGVAKFAFPL